MRFRQEAGGKGLSSYPHPWLMPDFWQFPTVSMGLGPIMAIYQARFMKYLHNRGIVDTEGRKVWAFMGDGEMDEPETLGAITLASREKLDNLIFVVNCNLQRLDGPVRGNGKIIQELEAAFRGAGWNVIKVIWGSYWDPLLQRDTKGLLRKRMEEAVDGEYQTFKAKGGAYTREHFFGKYPELKKMVSNLSDEDIWRLNRGGHDPHKVYAAYAAAVKHTGPADGDPGQDGQGLRHGRGRRGPEHHPPAEEDGRGRAEGVPRPLQHPDLRRGDRRRALLPPAGRQPGDPVPAGAPQGARRLPAPAPHRRRAAARSRTCPPSRPSSKGTGESRDLHHHGLRAHPDDADPRQEDRPATSCPSSRTRRAPSAWRACSASSASTRPAASSTSRMDSDQLMYYREDTKGQILEEGINEAGGIRRWIAAGTAYSNHGINMIPFYIFYSMFGFQRVGDLAWAAGDMQARGFLLGGTAGRTTLAGEGPAARGRPQPPALGAASRTASPTTRPTATSWP